MNPLVAILLGLAVLVTGALGYFQIYGSASANASAENTIQDLQSIFANVATAFANDPTNFTGFDNTDAIQAGMIPSSWIPTGSTSQILDPWGGAVTISANTVIETQFATWILVLRNVPEAQCTQIASFYTPLTYTIVIDNKPLAYNSHYTNEKGPNSWPPPPASTQADCSSTTSNTIEWIVTGQG